jgi:hypothetical protein
MLPELRQGLELEVALAVVAGVRQVVGVNVGVLQELQELELAPAEIALVQYPAVRT